MLGIITARAANAQGAWWNYPYAPWRIQPGFRAPPVQDLCIYANQA